MYGIAVLMLINVLRDGRIEMKEALFLVLAYVFYILSKIKRFSLTEHAQLLEYFSSDVLQRQSLQIRPQNRRQMQKEEAVQTSAQRTPTAPITKQSGKWKHHNSRGNPRIRHDFKRYR